MDLATDGKRFSILNAYLDGQGKAYLFLGFKSSLVVQRSFRFYVRGSGAGRVDGPVGTSRALLSFAGFKDPSSSRLWWWGPPSGPVCWDQTDHLLAWKSSSMSDDDP